MPRHAELPVPFLKWAGGKGQLLESLSRRYPRDFGTYHEPFVGGGAVFFHLWRTGRLKRKQARLADVNPDLVRTYLAVRDHVDELVARLTERHATHDEAHYYEARRSFNEDDLAPVDRAALVIYLNKTCFNGLFRVNSRGHFNVPVGRYVNPVICDEANLRACSAALQDAEIVEADFEAALTAVAAADFVYLDPPYVPITKTSYFTAYARDGFDFADQRRLAAGFRALHERGARVMLSNHETPELVELYEGFHVSRVPARRLINSRAERRDADVAEVIIRNYAPGER